MSHDFISNIIFFNHLGQHLDYDGKHGYHHHRYHLLTPLATLGSFHTRNNPHDPQNPQNGDKDRPMLFV